MVNPWFQGPPGDNALDNVTSTLSSRRSRIASTTDSGCHWQCHFVKLFLTEGCGILPVEFPSSFQKPHFWTSPVILCMPNYNPNSKTPPTAHQKVWDAPLTIPSSEPDKLCYTTAEAARLLACSTKSVLRLEARGQLKSLKALRTKRWAHAELIRFILEVSK